jgi:TolB-like protein
MQKEENNQERKETTELSFLGELKRRKVFRAAAAYLVVAWLVIQAASIVLPTFDVPAGSMRLVIIMATLGFPLVIVLAWAFELTPEGMKLTPDANNQDPETVSPKQNRKRNIAAFAFGAAVPTLGFLVLLVILILKTGGQDEPEVQIEKSIAVLPFKNLSSDEENAFFAGGVHEDILTNLAKINDLQVISRTSVMRYGENHENLRKIGEELGARYILEGSVRRAGDDVRVTVQLIDATTD